MRRLLVKVLKPLTMGSGLQKSSPFPKNNVFADHMELQVWRLWQAPILHSQEASQPIPMPPRRPGLVVKCETWQIQFVLMGGVRCSWEGAESNTRDVGIAKYPD